MKAEEKQLFKIDHPEITSSRSKLFTRRFSIICWSLKCLSFEFQSAMEMFKGYFTTPLLGLNICYLPYGHTRRKLVDIMYMTNYSCFLIFNLLIKTFCLKLLSVMFSQEKRTFGQGQPRKKRTFVKVSQEKEKQGKIGPFVKVLKYSCKSLLI